MRRIREVFAFVRPTLAELDGRATDGLARAIDAMTAGIAARAPAAEIESAIRAVEAAVQDVLPAS